MNPGNPQILTCPHCGKQKEIMSLLSGNTFGATLWSDNKQIAPMLPEISLVQKCPHCGKYFIRTRQKAKFADEGYSFEQGTLTLPEMIEAFKQLADEGFENEEEANVRMMLFHAYNDFYYRSKETQEIAEDHHSIFVEQGRWLLENLIIDDVMAAEFYREIGEFEKTREILEKLQPSNEFLQKIVDGIKTRVENNDTAVFVIEG